MCKSKTIHNYSIVKQVPARIVENLFSMLQQAFVSNIAYAFQRKATSSVENCGWEDVRSCRFKVDFSRECNHPEEAIELINQVIEWTISSCLEEYTKTQTKKLKETVKNLKKNYLLTM